MDRPSAARQEALFSRFSPRFPVPRGSTTSVCLSYSLVTIETIAYRTVSRNLALCDWALLTWSRPYPLPRPPKRQRRAATRTAPADFGMTKLQHVYAASLWRAPRAAADLEARKGDYLSQAQASVMREKNLVGPFGLSKGVARMQLKRCTYKSDGPTYLGLSCL